MASSGPRSASLTSETAGEGERRTTDLSPHRPQLLFPVTQIWGMKRKLQMLCWCPSPFIPSLRSLLPLLFLPPVPAVFTAKVLNLKNNIHSKLSVKSIQTGYRKAGVTSKQHLYVITWAARCGLVTFHRSAERKSFTDRRFWKSRPSFENTAHE